MSLDGISLKLIFNVNILLPVFLSKTLDILLKHARPALW